MKNIFNIIQKIHPPKKKCIIVLKHIYISKKYYYSLSLVETTHFKWPSKELLTMTLQVPATSSNLSHRTTDFVKHLLMISFGPSHSALSHVMCMIFPKSVKHKRFHKRGMVKMFVNFIFRGLMYIYLLLQYGIFNG